MGFIVAAIGALAGAVGAATAAVTGVITAGVATITGGVLGATATGIIGSVLSGAVLGATTSAIMGGDIGKGAIFGAVGGALTGAFGNVAKTAGQAAVEGAKTGTSFVDLSKGVTATINESLKTLTPQTEKLVEGSAKATADNGATLMEGSVQNQVASLEMGKQSSDVLAKTVEAGIKTPETNGVFGQIMDPITKATGLEEKQLWDLASGYYKSKETDRLLEKKTQLDTDFMKERHAGITAGSTPERISSGNLWPTVRPPSVGYVQSATTVPNSGVSIINPSASVADQYAPKPLLSNA